MTEDEKKVKAVEDIQEREQDQLLGLQNVVGLGVANKVSKGKEGKYACLSVFVSQKLPPADLLKKDQVPSEIDGIKTDVVETGVLFAGGASIMEEAAPAAGVDTTGTIMALRSRLRPCEGGHSVGHHRITAGTYATAVFDRGSSGIPRRYYILSNNHVLANSNDAHLGDPILQPGRYDGGTIPTDIIARLSRFVPIRWTGNNYVDAAIAEGEFHDLDREIYWIGYVKGRTPPAIGLRVQKTGRTTNYTMGRITAVNATVNVNYGGGRIARFVRQILTTNMSAGGDSGSLLLDMEEKAVGLLFAGSSVVTIHNDIRYVESLLGIRVI